MAATQTSRLSPAGKLAVALVVLACAAWGTSFWWLPPISGRLDTATTHDAAHEHHGEAHGQGPSTLVLSDEAAATLGIDVRPLRRSLFQRVIPIPGRLIAVPGVGRAEVTSPSSGVVAKILAREGQMIAPHQGLFEIQLIHDEGIRVQFDLLDALAEREVVDADLARLEDLERRSPGTIQGSRILEKIYKRRHLNHLIASRRQMLVLLGLPAADVDRMIESHLANGAESESGGHLDFREPLLLEKVVVHAPGEIAGSAADSRWLIEKLEVVSGQHVESGQVMAGLGDYQTLLIEADAFERDLDAIRTARDNAWPLTAAIRRRGPEEELLEDLYISDMAVKVDDQSRSAKFYVELRNRLWEIPSAADRPSRTEWTFRPGERLELRMPTERIPDAFKVPLAAVVRDGLDHYVFQVRGNTFLRRPVRVLHRDESFAVLAPGRYISEGVPLAMNSAYQLQLALLNKSADPSAHAHGHAH